jgi:iron complex outermembrane receptor protein
MMWVSCLAAGQDQTSGSLTGRITDAQGAIVANATVTVYARGTDARWVTATDSNGNYRFLHLFAGDYVVEAASDGFARVSRAIHIERGSPATLDLALEIAGPAEVIVVTASGTPQTVDEVSKAVSVVSAEEIERRDEHSISEALRTVPGLRIRQQGGPGTFTHIQTRGLRDSDTAILVDGLRLRDVSSIQGDATSFISELFTVNPDRIEVLRGSGSSLYGTNAIGGVVNIISDQGGSPVHGQLQIEKGQLGFHRGLAQLGGGLDENRFVYSGGLALINVRDGIDKTPARDLSGQGIARYNFTPRLSVSGRVLGNTSFLQLRENPFTADAFGPETGIILPPVGSIIDAVALSPEQRRRLEAGLPVTPGDANFVPDLRNPDYRRDSDFVTMAVTANYRPNDWLGYRASYQRVNTNRRFSDGPAGVGFQPAFNTISDLDGRIDTAGLQSDVKAGRYNLLTTGYEYERERSLGRDRDRNPDPAFRTDGGTDIEQRSHTFFIQDQFRALENRFQAAAAFRVQTFDLAQPRFFGGTSIYAGQRYDSPKTAYTGDGSISYFFGSTGTKARAHVGNGYRAPSLYERFGTFFSFGTFTPLGDPFLRPERSIAADAGIDQRLASDRLQASATYFYTRLQEVIAFDSGIDPGTDRFGRPFGGYRNTGGGLARGLELAMNAKPYRRLDLSASYTFTDAIDRGDSFVPGFRRTFAQPRHAFTIFAAQQVTRRLDVVFDMFAYGSYYFPFSGRAFRFRGPVKADLGANYTRTLSDRLSLRLYGKVENMFNREYFESGFRTPGATFTGGMSLRF